MAAVASVVLLVLLAASQGAGCSVGGVASRVLSGGCVGFKGGRVTLWVWVIGAIPVPCFLSVFVSRSPRRARGCIAAAQTQRITVSQSCATPTGCPITLQAGLNTPIEFRLTQPIVCDASALRECAVVIRLTNTNPEHVTLSACFVKWTAADWFQVRTVRFSAV